MGQVIDFPNKKRVPDESTDYGLMDLAGALRQDNAEQASQIIEKLFFLDATQARQRINTLLIRLRNDPKIALELRELFFAVNNNKFNDFSKLMDIHFNIQSVAALKIFNYLCQSKGSK